MNLQDRPLKLGTKVPTAIYTASDEPVCLVDSMQEGTDDREVARRLVACWNACLGMSTANLESMPGHYFGAVAAEPQRKPRVTTAAELKQQAKSDMSCVGAFARARPGKA